VIVERHSRRRYYGSGVWEGVSSCPLKEESREGQCPLPSLIFGSLMVYFGAFWGPFMLLNSTGQRATSGVLGTGPLPPAAFAIDVVV